MITPEFEKNLKNKLIEKGLNETQVDNCIISLTQSINEEKQVNDETKKREQQSQNELFLGIVSTVINNPNFSKIFKPHWLRLVYKFLIALLLVGAVVLLAWKGIFQASEASTLLGGIVGYMLGNTSK